MLPCKILLKLQQEAKYVHMCIWSTEIEKGKRKYHTNQKANSAANLFAIHFSHFHAVPKAESNESQKKFCLSSYSEAHLRKQTYFTWQADWKDCI